MAAYFFGAQLASVGLPTDIHTAAKNPLGTVQAGTDAAGGYAEYIYLEGIGSTVLGSVVTFGLNGTRPFLTALSVTTARGSVAVAMAAVLATQFGWYQVRGFASALFNGAAVAGALLFSASTGKCDDAVVAGDRIESAIVAATVSGAGQGQVFLNAPFMNGNG